MAYVTDPEINSWLCGTSVAQSELSNSANRLLHFYVWNPVSNLGYIKLEGFLLLLFLCLLFEIM